MSFQCTSRGLAVCHLLFAGLLSGVLLSTTIQSRAQGPTLHPSLEEAVDRARVAQAADHYSEAASAYSEATAIDPRIPELWANRGLMEHLAGDPAHAIESFKRALALNPSLYTAILFTGIDYVSLNQPDSALLYLKRALNLKPDNPDTYEALGKAYMAMHDPGRAASSYQEAVFRGNKSSAVWYGLGVSSLALIDQDGGVLAKRHSKSAWALALYGDEMLVQGKPLEAIDAYKQAAAVSSLNERQIFAAVIQRGRGAAEDSVKAAGSPKLSAGSADNLLSLVGTTGNSSFGACSALAKTEAANAVRSGSSFRRRMTCAYLQNDAKGSAATAAKQLASNPDDAEALYWSVKANEMRAVEAFAEFERLAPQSAATYDLVGDLFRRRMQPDNALEQYAKALAINPHDAPALLGTAAAYLSIGHTEESMSAAQRALADAPENARLNLLMAESLVQLQQYSEARIFLERCLASTRAANAELGTVEFASRAHALLGKVEATAGNISEAISEMNLGLSSDRDGSLHFQLSRLYRQQGKLADANQVETKAKELIAQRRARAVIASRNSTEGLP